MTGRTKKAPGAPVACKKALPVKKAATKKAAPRSKKKVAPVREKNLGGRPAIWNALALADALLDYIEMEIATGSFPILEEFIVTRKHPDGSKKRMHRGTFYDIANRCPELSDAIKVCAQAKEVGLQRGTAAGRIPPGFGNFALKQLGWKDTQEVEVTHGTRIVRLPAKKPIGDGA